MLTLDALRAYGANVDEGLGRCMNNEAFYLRMVGLALQDDGYALLGKALAENDLKSAFEAAHRIKGVVANLALTPILTPVSELTELLRHETPGDYQGLYEKAAQQKAALDELAK